MIVGKIRGSNAEKPDRFMKALTAANFKILGIHYFRDSDEYAPAFANVLRVMKKKHMRKRDLAGMTCLLCLDLLIAVEHYIH